LDFNLFELGTWNRLKRRSREAAIFSCVSISRTIALLLFICLFMSASAAGANEAPVVEGLISDAISPQPVGTAIKWTATTMDLDGDTIYYRFWLKGPSTEGDWNDMTGWTTNNVWTWSTSDADVGASQINVWIRDGNHEPEDRWDDYEIVEYTIRKSDRHELKAPVDHRPGPGPTPIVDHNSPPVVDSLTPNKASPQDVGTLIRWTATAHDDDGDTILYKFTNGTGTRHNREATRSTSTSETGNMSLQTSGTITRSLSTRSLRPTSHQS